MKLLITGGAGFIGTNFVRYIINKYPDYQIINLDKLTYAGNLDNLRDLENNSNYQFVQGDICDQKLVTDLVKQVDAIVHFAAESHVDRSIVGAEEFVRTNVLGTFTLLDAAKNAGGKRFHHISTDEVFGSLGSTGQFDEQSSYDPRSPYSASKAASDHLVRAYWHTHQLPVTISNCSNNYGPYQFPEKLISLLITNLLEGKKIPIYGQGLNVRDWIFVTDHCAAIDLILHQGKIGETYCVGGNSEKRNIDIAQEILQKMNLDEKMIEYVEDRKGHDWRYAIDFSKIKNELGWKPEYDFDQGLEETINWYTENKEWWGKLKKT